MPPVVQSNVMDLLTRPRPVRLFAASVHWVEGPGKDSACAIGRLLEKRVSRGKTHTCSVVARK